MKKLLLISALCLPASAAFATSNGPNPPPFQGGNTTVGQHTTVGVGVNATNKNTNNNVNFNSNVARGGAGGAGGNATSNSTSNATGGQGGNSSGASSNTNVNVTGDQDRLQAPAIGIPGIAIGNNCGLGASAGASFAGVAFGGAYSWADDDCLRLAFAAAMPGMPDVQLAILCQSRIVAQAMATTGRTCPGKPPASPTSTAISAQQPSNLAVWPGGVMPTSGR